MSRLKYSYLLVLLFVVGSCENPQREAIENKVREISAMITFFQYRIDTRGAEISKISNLSPAKKEEYRYDSLANVQELQIKAVKVFQQQVDSLKGVLDTLK